MKKASCGRECGSSCLNVGIYRRCLGRDSHAVVLPGTQNGIVPRKKERRERRNEGNEEQAPGSLIYRITWPWETSDKAGGRHRPRRAINQSWTDRANQRNGRLAACSFFVAWRGLGSFLSHTTPSNETFLGSLKTMMNNASFGLCCPSVVVGRRGPNEVVLLVIAAASRCNDNKQRPQTRERPQP